MQNKTDRQLFEINLSIMQALDRQIQLLWKQEVLRKIWTDQICQNSTLPQQNATLWIDMLLNPENLSSHAKLSPRNVRMKQRCWKTITVIRWKKSFSSFFSPPPQCHIIISWYNDVASTNHRAEWVWCTLPTTLHTQARTRLKSCRVALREKRRASWSELKRLCLHSRSSSQY